MKLDLENPDVRQHLNYLGAIYLLLGPACNMTCRHCSQTPIKGTYSLKPKEELSTDIVDFMKAWMSVKKKGSYSRIYFWGGEPLLYWETIKRNILLFEKENINPRCFRLFSNGLLLNDEIAEFCNKHNILFTMSYDAPNPTAVRNAVPSKENIKSFLKIKKRSVNTVFNAINHNPVKAFDMLEEIFPTTVIDMGLINILNPIPKDIYDFKEDVIEENINKLADEIVIKEHDPYGNRFSFFWEKYPAIKSFKKEWFEDYPWPPCAPGAVSLSMKFNGDILRCHNDNKKICNIKDNYPTIFETHIKEWRDLLPTSCLSCEVLPVCRNRCPIGLKSLNTSMQIEYEHCKVLKRIYSTILKNRERILNSDFVKYMKFKDPRDEIRHFTPDYSSCKDHNTDTENNKPISIQQKQEQNIDLKNFKIVGFNPVK